MNEKKLTYTKANFYDNATEAEIKAAYDYCVGYCDYMDNSKTEREAELKAKEVDCDAIVDKIVELDVQVRGLKTSTETKSRN